MEMFYSAVETASGAMDLAVILGTLIGLGMIVAAIVWALFIWQS
jgi:uncharacterized membrane protein YciS (DUF1049 family)